MLPLVYRNKLYMEENMEKAVQRLLEILGACAAYLFGDFTMLLQVLMVVMMLDLISGFGKVILNDSIVFDKSKAAKAPVKKLMVWLVIAFACQLDKIIPIEQAAALTITAGFYIAKEGMSFLGNIGESGIPFPTFIMKFLEKFITEAE